MNWLTSPKLFAVISLGAGAVLAADPPGDAVYEKIWQNPVGADTWAALTKAPPALILRPTQFALEKPNGMGGGAHSDQAVYINQPLTQILVIAYNIAPWRMVFVDETPGAGYDYLGTLPGGQNKPALQKEIKEQLGLAGRFEERETDVYLLKVKDAARLQSYLAQSPFGRRYFEPSGAGYIMHLHNIALSGNGGDDQNNLRYTLEVDVQRPVLDRTGTAERYDLALNEVSREAGPAEIFRARSAELETYGLELVPAREKIKILIVEKVR